MLLGVGLYMLHNTLQLHATQMAPESRGAAVALFAFFLFTGQSTGVWLASNAVDSVGTRSVFSAAAITDYLDGFLARRQGKVTFIGKVMDPVADKLLNSSAFIMLAAHGWVPAWVVCVIIGRELAVTGLRSVSAGKGIDVSASRLGKLKTGFQVAAIIPLMIHYPFLGLDPQAIGQVLLYLALAFTVWSGVDYFIKFKRLV